MAEDVVTVGELGRRFQKFEDNVTAKLDDVAGKLDNRPSWNDVRDHTAPLRERIQKLEDWQTWAFRIVLGGVVLAVLALVLVSGKP